MTNHQAEAFSRETFQCGNCGKDFESTVITWIDVSKTPIAKQALVKWQFNIVQCSHCGNRHFSGTPFFYEDFEEGLLVAVFPRIPDNRGQLEASILEKYGYYPILEFFYDMTQLWMLLYFQDHYKANRNLREMSQIGQGERRLHAFLRFLKEHPIMIEIREKLTESFNEGADDEPLAELLGRAVYLLEGMLPWPMDGICQCGHDISKEFMCCGRLLNVTRHESLLSRHFVIYCPKCKEAVSGASCERCGTVYTWKLGTIPSYNTGAKSRHRTLTPPGTSPLRADRDQP